MYLTYFAGKTNRSEVTLSFTREQFNCDVWQDMCKREGVEPKRDSKNPDIEYIVVDGTRIECNRSECEPKPVPPRPEFTYNFTPGEDFMDTLKAVYAWPCWNSMLDAAIMTRAIHDAAEEHRTKVGTTSVLVHITYNEEAAR